MDLRGLTRNTYANVPLFDNCCVFDRLESNITSPTAQAILVSKVLLSTQKNYGYVAKSVS